MKSLFVSLLLLFGVSTQAQTMIGLGSVGGYCNTSPCVVPNDVGDAITFLDVSGKTTWTINGETYAGAIAWMPQTTHTNHLIITPFTIHLDPSADVTGRYRLTRSGSGRGGWAWHPHWDFVQLVAD